MGRSPEAIIEYIMNDFVICFNAVVPVFLYMLIGYGARRIGLLTIQHVTVFNRICFNLFLPVNLFNCIYGSDFSQAVRPRLIVFAVVGVLLAALLSLPAAAAFTKQRSQRGVTAQALFRSNFVLIGLAVAENLLPGESVAAVAVLSAIIIPIFNVLAVIILSVYSGQSIEYRDIGLKILTNPLIISASAAVLLLLLSIHLPTSLRTTLNGLGAVATPLTLFLLGAFFYFDNLDIYKHLLCVICIGKLLLCPAVFLTTGYFLGFRGVEFAGLIGIFATSTSVSSCAMAQQIGGDDKLAASAIVMTNLLCPLTMFGWSILFKALGAF